MHAWRGSSVYLSSHGRESCLSRASTLVYLARRQTLESIKARPQTERIQCPRCTLRRLMVDRELCSDRVCPGSYQTMGNRVVLSSLSSTRCGLPFQRILTVQGCSMSNSPGITRRNPQILEIRHQRTPLAIIYNPPHRPFPLIPANDSIYLGKS